MTLADALETAAGAGATLEVWDGDGFRAAPWARWLEEARGAAGAVRALGCVPGARVGCVLDNDPSSVRGLLGLWLAGATVVSLPTPARGMHPEAYAAQLRALLRAARAEVLLAPAALAGADVGVRVVAWDALGTGPAVAPEVPDGDAIAVVQCSSGTTSEPRGVALGAAAIGAQLRSLAEAVELDPAADGVVSWLPLSHDMGLFGGFMLALATGMPLRLASPRRFVGSARSWFDDCAATGATLTVGPNFGLDMAARAARSRPPAGPLALRACIIGSEPVRRRTLDAALATLGPAGLTAEALCPAYGLAEATLAVTLSRPGVAPTTITADGAELVGCGPAVPGAEVAVDGAGDAGAIRVRSTSLAAGYAGEPELTAERFAGGELRTDDLGLLRDGELFVAGRADDVLLLDGRSVRVTDAETACADDGAVRAGRCAIVDAGERIVVLAEPVDEAADHAGTARRLGQAAFAAAGIPVDEVVVVPRGALPATPSGKLQRFRCRQLAGDPAAPALARVALRRGRA